MKKVQIQGAAEGWMIQEDGKCYSANGRELTQSSGRVTIKRISGQCGSFLVKDLLARNFVSVGDELTTPSDLNNRILATGLESIPIDKLEAEYLRRKKLNAGKNMVRGYANYVLRTNPSVTKDELIQALQEL